MQVDSVRYRPLYAMQQVKAPRSSDPVDVAVLDTPTSDPAVARMLNALPRLQKVEKQGHRYTVSAHTVAPDGGVYIGYREGYTTPNGYVAAVDKSGRIRWEASTGTVRALAVDAAGRLHIATDKEYIRMGSDGRELERSPRDSRIEQMWAGADGCVLGLNDKRQLEALQGALPAGLPDGPITQMHPTGDGRGVVLQTSKQVGVLLPNGSIRKMDLPTLDDSSRVSMRIDRVMDAPDGGFVLVGSRTIELRRPHGFHGSPFGPGGGMFFPGGGITCEPDPGEWLTQYWLQSHGADGVLRWKDDALAKELVSAVGADGRVFFAPEAYGSPLQSVIRVRRADQADAPQTHATVAGRVSALLPLQDSILAVHGTDISRIDSDGSVHSLGIDGRIKAKLSDTHILVEHIHGTQAWIVDTRDGSRTAVTDLDTDHSSGRSGELKKFMEEATAPTEQPTIGVADEWVLVDEVRVPRNNNRGQ